MTYIKMDIYKVGNEVFGLKRIFILKSHLMHLTGPEPRTLYSISVRYQQEDWTTVDLEKFWLRLYCTYVLRKPAIINDILIIAKDKSIEFDNERVFIYDGDKLPGLREKVW